MKDINEAAADTGSAVRLPKASPSTTLPIPAKTRAASTIPSIPADMVATNPILWPEESLEAERRFGSHCAKLYPFLGKTVATPEGPGML